MSGHSFNLACIDLQIPPLCVSCSRLHLVADVTNLLIHVIRRDDDDDGSE